MKLTTRIIGVARDVVRLAIMIAVVWLAVSCMTDPAPEVCVDCEAEMQVVQDQRGLPEVVEYGEECEEWWYGKYTCGGVKVRYTFDWSADSCKVSTLTWFGERGGG